MGHLKRKAVFQPLFLKKKMKIHPRSYNPQQSLHFPPNLPRPQTSMCELIFGTFDWWTISSKNLRCWLLVVCCLLVVCECEGCHNGCSQFFRVIVVVPSFFIGAIVRVVSRCLLHLLYHTHVDPHLEGYSCNLPWIHSLADMSHKPGKWRPKEPWKKIKRVSRMIL